MNSPECSSEASRLYSRYLSIEDGLSSVEEHMKNDPPNARYDKFDPGVHMRRLDIQSRYRCERIQLLGAAAEFLAANYSELSELAAREMEASKQTATV